MSNSLVHGHFIELFSQYDRMKIKRTELFLLPAGDMVGADKEDFYILYAPISQDICFMEKADAQVLRDYLEYHKTPEDHDLKELADNLACSNETPVSKPLLAGQTTHMSLMPNHKCNFSCSYCYSAKGRSTQTVCWDNTRVALDYFIDSQRTGDKQSLSLFISGGGEPLLSWDIVSQAIDYARERASLQGLALCISLVTNGSLLTEKKAKWLKERNCRVCVSFEVLEELQNSQRGHYREIRLAIEMLGRLGVDTMINATITPNSVGHMAEMTAEVVRCYPFIRQFTMEPVTSVELFPTPSSLSQFYDTFINEYTKAKTIAKEHGLHIRFAMDEALDSIVVRHCPGKFCLTAEGTITACHLATSSKESRYEKCVYGKVNEDGHIEIDEDKFRQLYEDNMLSRHRCDDCFARWNCGGECMARNDTYPQEYMDEVCRFNRRWLKLLLKERLEQEMFQTQGLTLREVALQTEIDVLRGKEIFVIPFNQEKWLLYAPLADSAALFCFDDIRRLGRAAIISDGFSGTDLEALDLLNDITDVVPVSERDGYVRSVKDFINLSILPNNVCNFSCSYCYSSKGRSKQRLSYNKVKAAVDFFVSPERNRNELLTVSIFGGGEPLLSWDDVVKPLLTYLQHLANEQHRRIVPTLITNGSILPDDFVPVCLSCHVDLVVSYEILRDVQDNQRRHYDLVTGNIRELITNGIVPSINTVVSPLNVSRIEETVEQLHRIFPEVKFLSVEPVIDLQMPDRRNFYSLFLTHFMQARKVAELYGIQLSCSASRKVDQTIERYCAGEMALCADGSLSICPCVSSPAEPHYYSYVYGKVGDDGTVDIDDKRLSELLSINIHTHPWCKTCFARWNCAGGCMHNNEKNGGMQDQDFCWFTREMTRHLIVQRLPLEEGDL